MVKSVYNHIRDAWKRPGEGELRELNWRRKIEWRKGNSFVRVERPTRLDRARALGYKAKTGYIIVRARIRRGGLRKPTIRGGRRAKRKGIKKIINNYFKGRNIDQKILKNFKNGWSYDFKPEIITLKAIKVEE